MQVEPDRLKTLKIYVRQPREFVEGPSQSFSFVVEDKSSYETDRYTATFKAPETSQMNADRRQGEFTGRHMLAAILAFFGGHHRRQRDARPCSPDRAGPAWSSRTPTWPASNSTRSAAEGRAQAALGWSSALTIAGGHIGYRLADRHGKAISLAGGTAAFRHPAYAADDVTLPLAPQTDGTLGAAKTIRDGVWIVEIHADAGLDHPYRETRRLLIRNGAMQ